MARMTMRAVGAAVFVAMAMAVCAIALGPSYGAEKDAAGTCRGDWTTPFANGQPFLLKDPRSGSFLYVESDNRHMSAIAPDGTLLWHRNLFDRKIQRFLYR